MLGVKRLSDFTYKNRNIDELKVQLLRDGKPFAIPENGIVTLLIALDGILVFNEPIEIVDYENGIIQTTLNTGEFGVGDFKCEYVLTNENDEMIHLTFPDNGFDAIKVTPSLKDKVKEE